MDLIREFQLGLKNDKTSACDKKLNHVFVQ